MAEKDKRRELRAYRTLSKTTIENARRDNLPCYICRQPIDYEAHPSSRWAPTFDHLHQLKDGGDILGTGLVAHRSCNSRRGNTKKPAVEEGWTRKWI